MYNILKKFEHIIKEIEVIRYESEENQIRIHIKLELKDRSILVVRDYKFSTNKRKYSYHWMDQHGNLKVRWDNTTHWKTVSTFPYHKHINKQQNVVESTETEIESVLEYIHNCID